MPQAVWDYEVSGKHVLLQWFSYRKFDRQKPPMGDKRPPSELCKIQPESWLAEYTTELLNVLHVLGRLVEMEERQSKTLQKVCASPTITKDDLDAAGALSATELRPKKSTPENETPSLFPDLD